MLTAAAAAAAAAATRFESPAIVAVVVEGADAATLDLTEPIGPIGFGAEV